MSFTPNNANMPAGVVYNPSGNNLPKFQAALNRVAQNGGNAHIIWVGTSTVEGENDAGPNSWDLAHTLESIFASDLTNIYGIPANADSIFGSNLPITDSDPRVVVGAGWVADTVYSIGGPMLVNTTTTNSLDYTMPTTADRVKIWYATDNSGSPTLGTFSWHVNSGGTTNINQGTSAPSVASTTITLTPGANTLHIARVSGTCKIIGVEPYLSTLSTVNIINSGVSGVVAGAFNDGSGKAYATNTAWNAISPDLTIIQMDNNDAISGTVVATYKTNITSVITGSNNGDCLLVAQVPYGAAGGTVANLPAYITALQQVAVASSVPLLNLTEWITSYDNVLTPIGWSNSDGLHSSPLGYIAQGQFITDQTMSMVNLRPVGGLRYFNGITDFLGTTSGFSSVGPYWKTAQATLNISGAPLTNGTAQVQMRVADTTTGGGAGIGGGVGLFFDDGNGVPRMGSAIWASKYDGTSGNTGADLYLGSRINGAAISTSLKLSATDAIADFTDFIQSRAGDTRVTSDFSVTSNASLAAITGLTAALKAGKTYFFDIMLYMTQGAVGGIQADINGGNATATNIIGESLLFDSGLIKTQTRLSALSTACFNTTTTSTTDAYARITGTITVNAAGTFIPRFAQSVSNGTASVVKRGSTMLIRAVN